MASNTETDIGKVISELSRIDNAAENVLIHMEANKHAYDNKIARDTAKFDKELEASINLQLASFEEEARGVITKELDKIRKETDQAIANLEDWYQNNHSSISKEIMNDFIKG